MTILIVVIALGAIVAVVVSSGDIHLPGGDSTDSASSTPAPTTSEAERTVGEAPARPVEERKHVRKPRAVKLPENPDDVRGTDAYSLTRPANLRRALKVLERERSQARGVFDLVRVAPGRIDTIIIHPDDRMTNIQVRADAKVSFENTHDFPTRPDFRKDGITARDVDVKAPANLLRAIDKVRRGSAAHDIDYLVIDRNSIDGTVTLGAYMRIRTPRPRMFTKEPGEAPRAIG